MKVRLFDFLESVGDIEIDVHERLENGHSKPLFIGYPEELEEHLKLSYSTERYFVFYITAINHGILRIEVVEE